MNRNQSSGEENNDNRETRVVERKRKNVREDKRDTKNVMVKISERE